MGCPRRPVLQSEETPEEPNRKGPTRIAPCWSSPDREGSHEVQDALNLLAAKIREDDENRGEPKGTGEEKFSVRRNHIKQRLHRFSSFIYFIASSFFIQPA
jgi:hypothetical protein